MKPTFFTSPAELRAWLAANHASARELWIGFHKTHTARAELGYPQALDEALAVGWIDGVRKRIDEKRYMIRFTPRKPKSIWSTVNIKRVGDLAARGLMQPAGLAAFEQREQTNTGRYSYEEDVRELDPVYLDRLTSNERAWADFQSRPASYQRAAKWWVMNAKKEETRLRRLAALIAAAESGTTLPQFTRRTPSKT